MHAPQQWLIFGCGYTGERLARRLIARGDRVVATRRSPEEASSLAERLGGGAEVFAADASRPESLAELVAPGQRAVYSAPPADERGEAEAAFARVCAGAGVARIIYLSSTGVYAPAGGAWVDEDVPAAPSADHGRRRLAAESELLAAARAHGVSAVSLRIAGIYGPGRGVHARMAAGGYSVLGAGDGFVSRIHVDDLVSSIVAAADIDSLPRDVYNVADDEPTTSRAYADGVAALLSLPPPPSLPLEQASPMARAFLGGDRRIANRRLKAELGVVLRYPTWRQGTRASIEEDG